MDHNIIGPGTFLVVDTSKAAGGVIQSDREATTSEDAVDGSGVKQTIRIVRHVDHPELVKLADQLANQARYAIRKHAISTSLGWICDTDGLRQIIDDIVALEAKARGYNLRAEAKGCGRRVRIGVVPVALEIDNIAAAREINRTLHETLTELAEFLTDGRGFATARDVQRLETFVHVRCRNLDRLAVGHRRFAVQDALEAARDAIRGARTVIKNKTKLLKDEFGDLRERIIQIATAFQIEEEPGDVAEPVIEVIEDLEEQNEEEPAA